MRIKEVCCCGAVFEINDDRSVFVNAGGQADSKGRRFQIEVIRDRWKEEHKECKPSLLADAEKRASEHFR